MRKPAMDDDQPPGVDDRPPGVDDGRVRAHRVETLSDAWGTLTRHRYEWRARDGSWGGQSREIYDHGHAVGCLALDPARGTVLLVSQLRFPIRVHDTDHPARAATDGLSIEVPAGLIDGREDPAETVRREVLEETGYALRDLTLVADLYASPGSLSERMLLYSATYGEDTRRGEGGGLAEEGEDIEVMEVPLDEALAMVRDGRVRDLKTAFLLTWAAGRGRGGRSG